MSRPAPAQDEDFRRLLKRARAGADMTSLTPERVRDLYPVLVALSAQPVAEAVAMMLTGTGRQKQEAGYALIDGAFRAAIEARDTSPALRSAARRVLEELASE